MTEAELRGVIAKNIIGYRKLYGQTQAELAKELNYSDKSVSKWERGEGMPDVYVLMRIAALYGISVNDLLREGVPKRKPLGRVLIALLSVGMVFLVAAAVYFALHMLLPSLSGAWLAFVFALPVSFIIFIVYASLWWSYRYQCAAVSGLIWSLALSMQMMMGNREVFALYIVAGILQILCILWFLFKKHASLNGNK